MSTELSQLDEVLNRALTSARLPEPGEIRRLARLTRLRTVATAIVICAVFAGAGLLLTGTGKRGGPDVAGPEGHRYQMMAGVSFVDHDHGYLLTAECQEWSPPSVGQTLASPAVPEAVGPR